MKRKHSIYVLLCIISISHAKKQTASSCIGEGIKCTTTNTNTKGEKSTTVSEKDKDSDGLLIIF